MVGDGDRETPFIPPRMPEGLVVSVCCGSICGGIWLALAISLAILIKLWLRPQPSDPTCSIQEFYLPALDKSANSTTFTSLFFDLELDNGNDDKGIHYDALNLTFYYGPNQSHPIGSANFPGFYQGYGKNSHRNQLLEIRGVPWEAVFRAVSNGTAVFRVDLATSMRFKVMFWKTKRKRLVVGSTVEVNDSGKKVNKDVILKPDGPAESAFRRVWKIVRIVFNIVSTVLRGIFGDE